MRLTRIIPAIALLAFAALSMGGEAKWYTSYAEAAKAAKKAGKPIMADFTGSDWCGWCIKLHKEVFDLPAFVTWADKNVILLELDYPQAKAQTAAIKKQNKDLAEKYKIQGYPTILFMDANGKVLGEYGYDSGGPAAWTKKAAQILKNKPGRSG